MNEPIEPPNRPAGVIGETLVERRASRRVNVLADFQSVTLVDLPSLGTIGLLVDVSENGVAVQSVIPIPATPNLEVSLSFGDKPLRGACQVIWSRHCTCGLRFLDWQAENRIEICRWLEALQASCRSSSTLVETGTSGASVAAPPASKEETSDAVERLLAEMGSRESCPLMKPNTRDRAGMLAMLSRLLDPATGHIQDPTSLTAEPKIDAQIIAANQQASDVASIPPQSDWRLRLAARHPFHSESPRSWSQENWSQARKSLQKLPSISVSANSGIPIQPPLANNRAASEKAAANVVVGIADAHRDDLWKVLRAEYRALGEHRKFQIPGRWTILLVAAAIVVASLALLQANKKHTRRATDTESMAVPAGGPTPELKSKQPVVTGIVNVVQGAAVLHSQDQSSQVRSPRITAGKVIIHHLPVYEASALNSRVQGDVHVVLTISDTGIVEGVRVVKGDSVLAKQVMNALVRWRYSPYSVDSEPVMVDVPVTVKFRIKHHINGHHHRMQAASQ